MKRSFLKSSLILAIVAISSTSLHADPIMTIVASSAPNFANFPSFAGYNSNALNSLENSLGNIGDRSSDPTAYEAYSNGQTISVLEMIVSNFNSWRGEADPTAPFDQENGNRLHFGLHIFGDGITQFRLEDLLFEISSDDGNSLGFSGDFVGLDYNQFRVGIDWGADRAKGGGDDTMITDGSATQFVDELVYVGVGNAFDASTATGATNQDKIFSVVQGNNYPIIVTGKYTLNDATGNLLAMNSAFVVVLPEPSSLFALGVIGLVGFTRRRRS